MPSRQINDFLPKGNRIKIELVARPGMVQVLLTETPVEGSCVEVAVRGLLTVHDDAVPLTRTIAVDGLAASFNKAESKDYARSDAAITNQTLTIRKS